MKLIPFILTLLVAGSLASAETTSSSLVPVVSQDAKAAAIFAPSPRYPVDAQGRHPTGHGIVVMEVDKPTGFVTSAHMEKSTGSKLLDDAAIEAFSRWRFKPGLCTDVHYPIAFTMRQAGYLDAVVVSPVDPHKTATQRQAVFEPTPHYPAEALKRLWDGTAILELVLRPDGTVSDVNVLRSSGHELLDQEGVRTFKRWHFRPGTVDHIQVPLTFSLKPQPRVVPPQKLLTKTPQPTAD